MPLIFSPLLAAGSWENIVFLAVIAIVGIVRWLSQQTQQTKSKPAPRPKPPIPASQKIPATPETDEQRVRRFLEALGQPTTTTTPPKISPRERRIFSPLPPLTTVPPDLPPAQPPRETQRQQVTPAEFPVPETSGVAPAASAAPRPEMVVLSAFPETAAPVRDYRGIRDLLKTRPGLQDAVILREIFGPPRALQPLEEMKTV